MGTRGTRIQAGAYFMRAGLSWPDAREEQQLSLRKRRVAGLSRGGVRPARLCEPQELSPTHHSKFAPLFLERLRRTLLMQFAAWGGGELRGPKSRKSSA